MVKYMNAYDRALLDLHDKLDSMSATCGKMLDDAILSLLRYDRALAQTVINADAAIDELDEAIELDVLHWISLQQPEDDDLRFLMSAMRTAHELERIADYASDIAEAAIRLDPQACRASLWEGLTQIKQQVGAMLLESQHAYCEKDPSLAAKMDREDDAVDQSYAAYCKVLTSAMKSEPDCVEQASTLLLLARYLERVGDHVVNIAEMIIFSVSGERHPFKSQREGKEP